MQTRTRIARHVRIVRPVRKGLVPVLALSLWAQTLPAFAASPATTSALNAGPLPGYSVLEGDTEIERKAARDRVRRADTDLPRRVIRRSLWTSGIAAAFALGFGVSGEVISRRMQRGYEEGMTLREYDRRVAWGKASNGIALGSILLSAVGLVSAAVMYTIEYNHCGPVAARSHRCRVLKQSQRSDASWRADRAPAVQRQAQTAPPSLNRPTGATEQPSTPPAPPAPRVPSQGSPAAPATEVAPTPASVPPASATPPQDPQR